MGVLLDYFKGVSSKPQEPWIQEATAASNSAPPTPDKPTPTTPIVMANTPLQQPYKPGQTYGGNDPTPTLPPSTQQDPAPSTPQTSTPAPSKKQISMVDMYNQLSGYKELSPEEQKAEDKRRRSNELIAAIGDGISSLANMYYTTKGAPNMYSPAGSLTERYRRIYEQRDAERKANKDKYVQGYLNAVQADREQGNQDRAYQQRDAANAISNYYKQQKLAMDADNAQQKQDNWDADHLQKKNDSDRNFRLRQSAAINTATHQRVMESQGAQHIAIARQNLTKPNSSKQKGTRTINLADGTYNYDASKEGALKGLAADMARKASAAATIYSKNGDTKNSLYFRTLGDAIIKNPSNALNFVLEHVAEFPSLQGKVKSIIGTASNKDKWRVGNSTSKPSHIAPPLK